MIAYPGAQGPFNFYAGAPAAPAAAVPKPAAPAAAKKPDGKEAAPVKPDAKKKKAKKVKKGCC